MTIDEMIAEKVTEAVEQQMNILINKVLSITEEIVGSVRKIEKYNFNQLLNEYQVAEILGVKVTTLRAWRSRRTHLPFTTSCGVRYRYKDVLDFINRGMQKVEQNGRIV